MARPDVLVQPVLAWREARRAALSAGPGSPGRTGNLQCLSSPPVAAPGGSSRARALCAGTARRGGAVADRGRNAGGRDTASIGRWQADRLGIRTYSGPAA